MFVINALENDNQQRMREIKCDHILPRNICFFGSNHFIVTYLDNQDEENIHFECRTIHNIF